MSLTSRRGLAWLRCCLGGRVEGHAYNPLFPAAEEPDMAIPWDLSQFRSRALLEYGLPSPRQHILYSGGELTRPCPRDIGSTSPYGRTARRRRPSKRQSQGITIHRITPIQ